MKSNTRALVLLVVLCPLLVVAGLFLGPELLRGQSVLGEAARGILVVRLWRVILGALVGSALAVSGVILQSALRNPLADPYVLGLSSGAGLATALAIIGGITVGGAGLALPALGFIGALASFGIVYALARIGGRTAPHTLILAGVVWGSVCGSILMFIVSQSSAEGVHAVLWWFLGDLEVFDVRLVRAVLVFAGVAAAVLLWFVRDLDALVLGDEMAGHVGLSPEKSKVILLALASVLTAACVCVSGLVAFVGLTVPHAARALVGPVHRRLLPAAALLGAAFLVVADGVGRAVFYPIEVPVGVITAFIGGPFFLLLLRSRQKDMWS